MLKRHRWSILSSLVALLVTAAVVVGLTPGAAMASSATTEQIAAAVSRIVDNKYSAADIALVKTRPEIARYVPAPDGMTFFVKANGFTLAQGKGASTGTHGAVIQAENCAGAIDIGVQQVSFLGNIIWLYIHHVEACSDNVNVTRFLVRRDMTRTDGTIEILEQTQNVQDPTPSASTISLMQRHLKQCPPVISCLNWYPWSQIVLYANHTYTFTGGKTT